MKTNLTQILHSFGHRSHPRVIARMDMIEEGLCNGQLPTGLQQKCQTFITQHPQCISAFHLCDLMKLLLSNDRCDKEMRSLIIYALAYFWEEQDTQYDCAECGMDDDRHILNQIHRLLKPQLDDWHLKMARPRIHDAWLRNGQQTANSMPTHLFS